MNIWKRVKELERGLRIQSCIIQPACRTLSKLIECEKCKCLINKDSAFRGVSTVKTRYFNDIPHKEVEEHYFCHRCKPAEKKAKK